MVELSVMIDYSVSALSSIVVTGHHIGHQHLKYGYATEEVKFKLNLNLSSHMRPVPIVLDSAGLDPAWYIAIKIQE